MATNLHHKQKFNEIVCIFNKEYYKTIALKDEIYDTVTILVYCGSLPAQHCQTISSPLGLKDISCSSNFRVTMNKSICASAIAVGVVVNTG